MRRPVERLRHMLSAIDAIERYRDRDRAAFEQDELLQARFLLHLHIIGEDTRTLPDAVRAIAPDVPWNKIIGMRNILVHGYFNIDRDIVWEAATRDAPALRPLVERPLHMLDSADSSGRRDS
jgi:uncharacterized protein with HEPN domain